MTVTIQNLIQEEIKRRPNSGSACYHSVQNFLSSRLLSKNIKIRIYKTIILPVILYGCKTWSLTLRNMQTEGVCRQGADVVIWTKERCNRRVENTAYREVL
jgi:hypothetical protein